MNSDGTSAGYTDFKGSAEVAEDGNTWSGKGTLTQYDVSGKVVFTEANFTYKATRFNA
jgi:hypothetical protein